MTASFPTTLWLLLREMREMECEIIVTEDATNDERAISNKWRNDEKG